MGRRKFITAVVAGFAVWAALGAAVSASPANSESALHIEFAASLDNLTIPNFPNDIGETKEFKEREHLRYRFLLLEGPHMVVSTDGALQLHAKFYGDIETAGKFPGCHLGESPGHYEESGRWVYVNVVITAKPVLTKQGDSWILSATDVTASPSLSTGPKGQPSDTQCSIFNIDVKDKIEQAFKIAEGPLTEAVANGIAERAVVVPLSALWDRLAGAYKLAEFESKVVCASPSVRSITIGQPHRGESPTILAIGVDVALNPTVVVGSGPCIGATPPSAPVINVTSIRRAIP